MGLEIYVAIQQADWLSGSTLRECAAKREPIGLAGDMPKPASGEVDWQVKYRGRASVVTTEVYRLDKDGVYQWEAGSAPVAISSGSPNVTVALIDPKLPPIPHRLNDDLRKINVVAQPFKTGDYVVTLQLGDYPVELQSGFLLAAALIKCTNGFGFELESGGHGRDDFARQLESEASALRR